MDYLKALKPNAIKVVFASAITFFIYLYIYYQKNMEGVDLSQNKDLLITNILKEFINIEFSGHLKFVVLFGFWFTFSTVVYLLTYIARIALTRIENEFIIRKEYTNLK